MITVLAGGVGAARFLRGLVEVIDPREIAVVVNTADDFTLHGLAISPDLDTVMYTLAGEAGEHGWGRSNESWRAMKELHALGVKAPHGSRATDWFSLGDRDIATHLYRSQRLSEGADLTQVTRELCVALDVVRTRLTLAGGENIDFQEYFVKRQHDVPVVRVSIEGAETAKPSLEALDAIRNAERLIIAPSNPILSIGPILAIDELASAIRAQRERCVAISPLIAGHAVKGPADHLMTELGHRADVIGVAELWSSYASHFVIDTADQAHLDAIRAVGMNATDTRTLMSTVDDARHLADTVLAL